MRHLALLLIALFLTACSENSKITDIFADWTAEDFYSEANRALKSGEFETAIKQLETLEARFPFSPFAKQAQLDVAYAYYRFDEADSAIAAADRFIRLNPRDPHVDYAWYLKGLSNFTRGSGFLDGWFPRDPAEHDIKSMNKAIQDFSTLVRRFPESKYAGDSYKRLVFLRNKLAEHEIKVAEYYIKRGAWLAAARRAQYTIEHYQQTPASRKALQVLEQAYNKLNLPELVADTRLVIKANQKDELIQTADIAKAELGQPPRLN